MNTLRLASSTIIALAALAALSGCSSSSSASASGGASVARDGGSSSTRRVEMAGSARDAATEGHASSHHDAASSSPDAGTGTDAAVDADADVAAPMDVDNGAPSDAYPAPHPPMPTLENAMGGPVLTKPNVYLIFYPGYPYVGDLEKFATNMTTATYWGTVATEYGVGALSYKGATTLTGQTPPTTITQVDLGTWMGQEIASGAFGTPDPQGIYTIVFPSTTTITQPNPVLSGLPAVVSCVAFGGYHDNVAVPLTDGGTPQNFAYAVIPTCDTYVDDLTAAMSHEFVEAATDPFLTSSGTFALTGGPDSAYFMVDQDHIVWALIGGGEAGDLCEPEGDSAYITPPDVGYTVQRIWSNVLAKGSHDPCSPNLAGMPGFNSAPVLPETVTFTSAITGTITSQGVTVPPGTSKTIEVDLFSDGDTGGPWTVTADDLLYQYYGSYGLEPTLAFSWDRTSGVNGDKLHLTITVIRESLFGGAHAFVITSNLGSRQVTWSGLVVE